MAERNRPAREAKKPKKQKIVTAAPAPVIQTPKKPETK